MYMRKMVPLADYLTTELIRQGKRSLAFYPQARPAICEEEAVTRLLTYQKQIGVRSAHPSCQQCGCC